MIGSFRNVNKQLINEICECFEQNYDFNSLREKYSFLEYNMLWSILYSRSKYGKELYNYLCQTKIDDRKILIISDTHYGSVYENINYIYKVFNFAIANDIRVILHGGDIIESNIRRKNRFNNIKQANYFIDNYPYDNNINTYALLGNHDYSAILMDEVVRDILCSRNDINVLGIKKSYLNWCGNTISLYHKIDNYKLSFPINADIIGFKGHSHFYHVKEKKYGKNEKIYIPSLCDDFVNCKSNGYINDNNIIINPGFLTAEIENDNIIVSNYSFCCRDIIKENEFIKVLDRSK